MSRAIVVGFDLVSALGPDAATTWSALVAGQSGIRAFGRFPAGAARPSSAACVEGLAPGRADSLVVQMLRPLLERHRHAIPADARLLLATTNGEIDHLERALAGEAAVAEDSVPTVLAARVQEIAGLTQPGVVVSAACASSTVAIAEGAAMIRTGEASCILVVACDFVSEFVAAGFRSLGALAPDRARPFDRGRRGVSLGEAAGFVLLMDERRARDEARPLLAEVAGSGASSDADHITAPSASGQGLAAAIRKALAAAGVDAREVGSICAHGTGTRTNDAMELQAFARVFAEPIPTYSVKGALGHTMGTAGLLDAIVAVQSSTARIAPPTAGLLEPDEEAAAWVSTAAQTCSSTIALSTNSGFGGVNCALVLRGCEGPPRTSSATTDVASPRVRGLGWIAAGRFAAERSAVAGSCADVSLLRDELVARAILSSPIRRFAKLDAACRAACLVAALTLHDAGLACAGEEPHDIAVLGTNAQGCLETNRAFYADYLGHERRSGRGSLFVATLPSIPLSEVSMHFKLVGPAAWLGSADARGEILLDRAAALLRRGESAAVLCLDVSEAGGVGLLLERSGDAGGDAVDLATVRGATPLATLADLVDPVGRALRDRSVR